MFAYLLNIVLSADRAFNEAAQVVAETMQGKGCPCTRGDVTARPEKERPIGRSTAIVAAGKTEA